MPCLHYSDLIYYTGFALFLLSVLIAQIAAGFPVRCHFALDTGMRAVLSRGLTGGGDDEAGGKRRLREAREELAEFGGEERLGFMLAPHAPYTCSGGYLKRVAEAARKKDVLLHHIQHFA